MNSEMRSGSIGSLASECNHADHGLPVTFEQRVMACLLAAQSDHQGEPECVPRP